MEMSNEDSMGVIIVISPDLDVGEARVVSVTHDEYNVPSAG